MEKNINDIIKLIKKMTILELNELIKCIEKEFDIKANMVVAGATKSEEIENAEPKEVNLFLKSFGTNKISIIKIVKEILGVGLMDAKKIVESAPVNIKENITPEIAKELLEKFKDTDCEIEAK